MGPREPTITGNWKVTLTVVSGFAVFVFGAGLSWQEFSQMKDSFRTEIIPRVSAMESHLASMDSRQQRVEINQDNVISTTKETNDTVRSLVNGAVTHEQLRAILDSRDKMNSAQDALIQEMGKRVDANSVRIAAVEETLKGKKE